MARKAAWAARREKAAAAHRDDRYIGNQHKQRKTKARARARPRAHGRHRGDVWRIIGMCGVLIVDGVAKKSVAIMVMRRGGEKRRRRRRRAREISFIMSSSSSAAYSIINQSL